MNKLIFAGAALCALSVNAFADEVIKVRAITHVIAAQSLDVGDVDGHAMTVAKGTGLASFPDGTVGTTTWVSETDYTKGSGEAPRVWMSVSLPDGSTVWAKCSGGTTLVQGNKAIIKNAGPIAGGTGKFAGAMGDFSFTGERMQAALFGGAELYADIVINIKK
jgi:hypothetical protein